MNIEFHYYITHFLCNHAGFNEQEARIIAYSSQFIDHNIISYVIDTGKERYHTIPTQNYGFWDDSFPKEVYIPFHFFPGNPEHPASARKDRKKNPINCTPNSPQVKELLVAALKTRNPYRVGIALHTYADSFVHQNFSGRLEDWNSLDTTLIIPPIGHAHALRKPDVLTVAWEDPRLMQNNRKIINRERIFKAAKQVYKYLKTYNRLDFNDAELITWKLEDIVGPSGNEKPFDERVSDFIIEENMMKYDRSEWISEAFTLKEDPGDERLFTGYDKFLWLKNAVLYRSSLVEQRPLRAKTGFYDSHFYKWHESAREHLRTAKSILKGVVY